jgi:tetratricopeptide (TPR) repeat protein
MKSILLLMTTALAACALVTVMAAEPSALAAPADFSSSSTAQDKNKDQKPQISEGEQKALAKIEAAPDTAAKIQAITEFANKYPKSTQRAKVISYSLGEINKIPDQAQKIAMLEKMLTVFKEPTDADIINPFLVDAYVKAEKIDDAFRVASAAISRNPNDVAAMTQMTMVGVEQAKRQNPKYVQQSMQYGTKAIELIEAGKRPDQMDEAAWGEYRTRWLPQLYQSLGMLSMMSGNKEEAKTRLEKASSLNANDPFTFLLLGSLVEEEYRKFAEQHKAQSPGPLKDELLKQAHAKMDQVIEQYAHAVALSEGKPEYQKLHDQILEALDTYYKYRHAGSNNGLQQLIDKYKKQ